MAKYELTESDRKIKFYRVWKSGSKPEKGELIRADSSFEARKLCAAAWGKDVTDVMARLER